MIGGCTHPCLRFFFLYLRRVIKCIVLGVYLYDYDNFGEFACIFALENFEIDRHKMQNAKIGQNSHQIIVFLLVKGHREESKSMSLFYITPPPPVR